MSSSPNTTARAKAIAILPKFTAFLSVLGSGFIIYDIVCSHFNVPPAWWRKNKSNEFSSSEGFRSRAGSSNLNSNRCRSSRRFAQRKTLKNSAYYRLMLAMSSSDFLVSFAWFCTTWPIPRDELVLDNPSETVYGNIGTPNTCTAQAFFIQLGIVTPFYNALLALYYYLTIRREWKEEDFKTKIETAGHMVSLAWGLGTSIAGLIMNIYNNSNVWCWINVYPAGCGGDGKDQCIRGQNAQSLRWIFYYGPLWVMIFLVALFMSLVYIYVRGLDNKMDQYTRTYRQNAANAVRASADQGSSEFHSGGGDRRRSLMARTFSTMNADTINEQRRQRRNERSKAVANQGLFYAGTFALVWVFGTIVRAMQLADAKPPWAIIFLFAVFTPSQGFFNFLVYVRPRIIKHFEMKKKQREGKRNSKTGSSFNSDILHVSGISGASSSNEVTGENQNKDNSTRSDVELSDPFTLNTRPDLDTPKVRFATSEMNVDNAYKEESRNQSKVRFDSSRVRFNSTKVFLSDDEDLDKGAKGNDSDPANPKIGITTVDVTLNIGEKDVPPEAAFNDIDDEETESEGTIDPALLLSVVSDDEVEKEKPLTKKGNRDELVQLHNATIDLATGEVRTRTALRRVSPP